MGTDEADWAINECRWFVEFGRRGAGSSGAVATPRAITPEATTEANRLP